jgi:hypothetical protein
MSTMIETEYYTVPLHFHQKLEWYAEQMDVTVDYLLDEFYADGTLVVPSSCTHYDYESHD